MALVENNENIHESEMTNFSSLRFTITSRDKDDEVLIVEDSVTSRVDKQNPPDDAPNNGRGMDSVGPHIDTIRVWIENVLEASLRVATPNTFVMNILNGFVQKRHIPLDVGVTYELENSLQCLTACLKDFFFDHQSDLNLLIEQFSRIPDLIMTIMLIEDDADRKRVLDYPIVKWALMSKYSLVSKKSDGAGESFWLIDLIESGKTSLRKQVIEYLDLISTITAKDLLPKEFRVSENNLPSFESRMVCEHKEKFHSYRKDLFMSLIQRPGFIPTLLSLSDDQLEDAASTGVIKYAVEWNLYQPIGVAVVFLDLVSHIVITFSTRFMAHYWVMIAYGMIADDETLSNILLLSFATLGVIYWLFRRICVLISLFSISPRTYFKYLLTFWDLLDLVTLGISSFIYIVTIMYFSVDIYKKYPQFMAGLDKHWYTILAILMGLLWLDLLGLFKVLNKKFATLILAISKIAIDAFMFLLVLVVTILATGDMLHIYLSTNFQVCPENNPNITSSSQEENTSAFCAQDRGSSYMAIYNMYIGDISFDDFSGTVLTIFIYLGLTFFGVIILLNVIIALVCDSYQKSNEQSDRLFGRARVSYVATVIAFEDLIKPKKWKELSWRRLVIQVFVEFFKFAICLAAFTILIGLFDTLRQAMVSWIGWCIATLVILPFFIAWVTFSSYLITGWETTDGKFPRLKKLQNNILVNTSIFRAVIYITRLVLGTHGFNSTNELNRVPVTTQHDYQNENGSEETLVVEESINEKLSTIQQNYESSQNEIKEIKNEVNSVKYDVNDVKNEVNNVKNDVNDIKNELKGITKMLRKMMRD